MTRERESAILVALCGALVVTDMGYVGYTIWRDFQAKRDNEAFKAKIEKRQEEIKARMDVAQWEAET